MSILHVALLSISYGLFGDTSFGTSDTVKDSVSLRRPTNGNLPQKDAIIISSKRPAAKKRQHHEIILEELTELFATIEVPYCNSASEKYEFSQKFTNSRVVDDEVSSDAGVTKHVRSLNRALFKFGSCSKFCHLLSELGSCSYGKPIMQ